MQNAVLVVAGSMGVIMEVFRLRTPLFTLQQLSSTAALQHCRYSSVLVLCQFYFEPETRSAADD